MSSQWYYFKGDERLGPFSSSELKGLASTGRLVPTDNVWKEGMEKPFPAIRLKGLFQASTAAVNNPATEEPKQSPLPISAISIPPELQTQWHGVYGRDLTLLELLIVEAFRTFVPDNKRIHRFPNIPENKWQSAKYATVQSDELIVALYDDTLLGSASDGFVITTSGIYWHNPGCASESIRLQEINPEHVHSSLSIFSKGMKPSPSTHVTITWNDPPIIPALTEFVKYAAAFSITLNASSPTMVRAAAQDMLSAFLVNSKFDAWSSVVVRQLLDEPSDTPPVIHGDGRGAAPASKDQPLPYMMKVQKQSDYPRIKEDLFVLQKDIAGWFKGKGYRVGTTDGTKQLGLTAKLEKANTSQPVKDYMIHIVLKDDCYTVTFGYGNDHGKSGGTGGWFGKFKAIASGYNPWNEEDVTLYWSWLDERSAKCCPECQKKDASIDPFNKFLSTIAVQKSIHGEQYEVHEETNQKTRSCQWCSHEWSVEPPKTTERVSLTCPGCGEALKFAVENLDLDKSLKCAHCDKEFLTRAQLNHQKLNNVCPNCRVVSKVQPVTVEKERSTSEQDIHGERYTISTVTRQAKHTCSSCSHGWHVGTPETELTALVDCPGCKTKGFYNIRQLELHESLKCAHCYNEFLSRAQLNHQKLTNVCPNCRVVSNENQVTIKTERSTSKQYIHGETYDVEITVQKTLYRCQFCSNEWQYDRENKTKETVQIYCPCGKASTFSVNKLALHESLKCSHCGSENVTDSQYRWQKRVTIQKRIDKLNSTMAMIVANQSLNNLMGNNNRADAHMRGQEIILLQMQRDKLIDELNDIDS